MDQLKIGAFISDCRKRAGLTQEQLAERLSVTGKAVSKWENGKSMPDVALLVPLSKALGISLNELMEGEPIVGARMVGKTDAALARVPAGNRGSAQVGAVNWLMLFVGLALMCVALFADFAEIAGVCVLLAGMLMVGVVIKRLRFGK